MANKKPNTSQRGRQFRLAKADIGRIKTECHYMLVKLAKLAEKNKKPVFIH